MYRDSEQREFARRLRNAMTPAEQRLWRLLRADQLAGYCFRRQAAIGPYIVDFACFSHRLIVDFDGPQHAEASGPDHDAARTSWLGSRGFRVLRFWNHQLDDDIHGVIDLIWKSLRIDCPTAPLPLSPALSAKERGPEA